MSSIESTALVTKIQGDFIAAQDDKFLIMMKLAQISASRSDKDRDYLAVHLETGRQGEVLSHEVCCIGSSLSL